MLNRPKNSFAKSAATLVIATGLTFPFAANASNDDCAKFENVNQKIVLVKEGLETRQSTKWSKCHKDGLSISISMGTDPRNPDKETIFEVIAKDMDEIGLGKFTLFFRQNDVPATIGSIQHKGHTLTDPLGLGSLRKEVKQTARNIVWEQKTIALENDKTAPLLTAAN